MINIKNLRYDKPLNEWDVIVDRTSVLGNKFTGSEADREYICRQYADWMVSKGLFQEPVKKELIRIAELYKKHKKLNLFCWCAPKQCHAETIKNIINKIDSGILKIII